MQSLAHSPSDHAYDLAAVRACPVCQADAREAIAVLRHQAQRPRLQPAEQISPNLAPDRRHLEIELPAAVEKATRLLDALFRPAIAVLAVLFCALLIVQIVKALAAR